MSFGRFLGQSSKNATWKISNPPEELGLTNSEQPHNEIVETAEIRASNPVEENDANREETTEETHQEETNGTEKKKRLNSKFVNSLEKYQILGAMVESVADFLAPTLLSARESAPPAVVKAVKTVDTACFDTLRVVEEIFIVQQLRNRIPNHEVQ